MWKLFCAVAVFVGVIAVRVNGQQCTLCADGSASNPNGTIGAAPCSDIEAVIGSTPANSTQCRDVQLQGFLNCGCPTFPGSFCPMCADGFFSIAQPNKQIPILNDTTCEDALFAEIAVENACSDIERTAHFCGCPGAPEPICKLCANGPAPSKPTRRLPPSFTLTCADYSDLVEFSLDESECANAINGTLPIHTSTYCGCVNVSTPVPTCSLCGDAALINADMNVAEPDVTCQELFEMAPFLKDQLYCSALQANFTICCEGGAVPAPTMSPTTAPDRSPQAQTESPSTDLTSGARWHASIWLLCALSVAMVASQTP